MEAWIDYRARRDGFLALLPLHDCDRCDGCGQRCADGFKVTRDEAAAALRAYAELTGEERDALESQPLDIPWPGECSLGATYRRCRFRDHRGGRCAIYAARPTVCRFFGHVGWFPCPIEKVAPAGEPAPTLWREYLAMERKTWEEWEAEGVDPTVGNADLSTPGEALGLP